MLKRFGQRWMVIANAIGNFNSRVVLSIFYAIVVLPFGLVVRLFGDPLNIRGRRETTWTAIENPTRSLSDGKRQF